MPEANPSFEPVEASVDSQETVETPQQNERVEQPNEEVVEQYESLGAQIQANEEQIASIEASTQVSRGAIARVEELIRGDVNLVDVLRNRTVPVVRRFENILNEAGLIDEARSAEQVVAVRNYLGAISAMEQEVISTNTEVITSLTDNTTILSNERNRLTPRMNTIRLAEVTQELSTLEAEREQLVATGNFEEIASRVRDIDARVRELEGEKSRIESVRFNVSIPELIPVRFPRGTGGVISGRHSALANQEVSLSDLTLATEIAEFEMEEVGLDAEAVKTALGLTRYLDQ